MEGCIVLFLSLCQSRNRKLVSVVALMFSVLLALQTFTLSSKRTYSTQYASSKLHATTEENSSDDNNWLDEDDNETLLKKVKDSDNDFLSVADGNRKENAHLAVEQTGILDNESLNMQRGSSVNTSKNAIISVPVTSLTEDAEADIATSFFLRGKQVLSDNETLARIENSLIHLNAGASNATALSKKNMLMMPPLSLSEMNRLLLENRASCRSMRPRWSSALDNQILAAKKEIENAPILEDDRQLFAPLYRNISKFRRSYKLMERTLKIYIYQEGEKPIFHQPLLKGIYAAEGWFMKLMESNRQYLVKDPSQAHLFYMPFSSRFLQLALYVPGSHNRTDMRLHLKNYLHKIAAKYSFWNRTGGADHFLAACHDWALNETNSIMDRSIRALCVADLSIGIELGRDVCLPETKVHSPKNPLKDLGGRSWNQRPILAFFAGNLHGSLRSRLLKHWENKEPGMKIFGPSTFGAARSELNYIQHMKRSKYCVCPRGYEVNSPRLVESIFFECVPVIIADNYVPPFFEILNWDKFSVFVPEKDVPRLKEILVSINESEYRELQMGVKKVQRHFLWRTKPVKYDLFHMMLHSIWLNRVYNIEIG